MKILIFDVEGALVMYQQLMEVQLADGKLDVVDNFAYLCDCICLGRGCDLASIKRCHSVWGKFRELLPLLN